MIYQLPAAKIGELFAAISSQMSLYMPIESDGLVQFGQWTQDATVNLNKLNTVRSPKDFFFSPTENIAAFRSRKKEIEIVDAHSPIGPFALFGVRACDAQSLNLLDKVFLTDPVDTFYQARRENGIVITSACLRPEESCFCGVFGIDALNPGGDIATWLVEDTLYWQPLTERGSKLTTLCHSRLDGEPKDRYEKNPVDLIFEPTEIKLPLANLDLSNFTQGALMEIFNSPKWAELYPTCLGCGTCTFICPTCHCYDIQDFNTGDKIIRHRCWDSCMYSDFTLMAHGNPRTSQLERFRQRYMHKLVYFPDNNDGAYACTGCGRCVQKCSVSINIAKVIKAFSLPGEQP